jgi:hypothetical protein
LKTKTIKGYRQIKKEKNRSQLKKAEWFFDFSRTILKKAIARRVKAKPLEKLKLRQGLALKKAVMLGVGRVMQAIQGLALKIGAGFKNLKIQIYLKIKNYKIKNFLKGIKGIMGNKVYLRKALAALTIFAVIITAYFQNTPYASAATFT